MNSRKERFCGSKLRNKRMRQKPPQRGGPTKELKKGQRETSIQKATENVSWDMLRTKHNISGKRKKKRLALEGNKAMKG